MQQAPEQVVGTERCKLGQRVSSHPLPLYMEKSGRVWVAEPEASRLHASSHRLNLQGGQYKSGGGEGVANIGALGTIAPASDDRPGDEDRLGMGPAEHHQTKGATLLLSRRQLCCCRTRCIVNSMLACG